MALRAFFFLPYAAVHLRGPWAALSCFWDVPRPITSTALLRRSETMPATGVEL